MFSYRHQRFISASYCDNTFARGLGSAGTNPKVKERISWLCRSLHAGVPAKWNERRSDAKRATKPARRLALSPRTSHANEQNISLSVLNHILRKGMIYLVSFMCAFLLRTISVILSVWFWLCTLISAPQVRANHKSSGQTHSLNRAFSCDVITAMLEGKNNTFSLLWEIWSIFMQNCFIVSALQHGPRENPL